MFEENIKGTNFQTNILFWLVYLHFWYEANVSWRQSVRYLSWVKTTACQSVIQRDTTWRLSRSTSTSKKKLIKLRLKGLNHFDFLTVTFLYFQSLLSTKNQERAAKCSTRQNYKDWTFPVSLSVPQHVIQYYLFPGIVMNFDKK